MKINKTKLNKFKKPFIIFFLVLVVAVGGFFVFSNKEVSASWWNESWHYRKAINLSSTESGSVTDMQVAVTIDTASLISAGKMQAACQDIRFTDSSGQVLPYWIEENNPGCNNTATKIWLKVPTLQSGTDTTAVYFYYDNKSAFDEQSGEDVFLFFDDFNDSSIDPGKWAMENIGDGGSYTEESGELKLTSSNNLTGSATAKTLKSFTNDVAIEWRRYDTEEHYNLMSFGYGNITDGDGSGGNNFWHTTFENGYFNRVQDNVSFTYRLMLGTLSASLGVVIDGPNNNQWINHKNIYSSEGLWNWYTDTGAGYNLLGTGQNDTTHLNDEKYILLSRGGYSGATYGGTSRVDYIFVREYMDADPSASEEVEEIGPAPVGHWSFDEGYGTTAHDESSNKNDGVITGATWKDESECVSGKCLYFDGTGNKVDVPIGNGENVATNPRSFSMWVRPTSARDEIFFSVANGTNQRLYISIYNSKWNMGIQDNPQASTSGSDVVYNEWYHVYLVMDGENAKLYVNGKYEFQKSYTSFLLVSNYIIGMHATATNFNFLGSIDAVKVYPYARTADQIKQDYNAGLAGVGTSRGTSTSFGGSSEKWMNDGLVGHWKMDEASWNGTAGEVKDASGNGNDGVAAGGATTGAGTFGNGGDFDGVDDYIDGGNGTSLNITSEITVSSWVKFNNLDYIGNTGTLIGIASKGNPDSADPNSGWWLAYDNRNNGKGFAYTCFGNSAGGFSGGGNNFSGSGYEYTFTNDTWYNISFIISGNQAKLYINGAQHGPSKTLSNLQLSDTTRNLNIGIVRGVYEMDGIIDETRIYNRALSPSEVQKLYEYAPGPVLHMKMDEKVSGDAKTIYDISGNENNGTTYDGANDTGMDCTAQGKYGNACEFDGEDDYVRAGTNSSLDIKNSITLEAWVKPDTLAQTNNPEIISKSGSAEYYRIRFYNGGKVSFKTYGLPNETLYSVSNLSTTNWNHIAMSYDGSYKNIYINGILNASVATTGSMDGNTGDLLYIGGFSSTENLKGLIDDVKIYNYARTQKQILEDMHNGDPLKGAVLDMSFDEGYGDTAHDGSASGPEGNQNNGTLVPGATGGNTTTSSMWTKDGKLGGAMEFDGVDDYVSVSPISVGNDISLSAWVNVKENVNSFAPIIEQGGDRRFRLIKHGNRFCFGNDSVTDNFYCTENIFSSFNSWYHILAINDGNYYIFIDGVEYPLTQQLGSYSSWITSQLNIGYRPFSTLVSPLSGKIDEVKIFPYALNEEEIGKLYNSSASTVIGEDVSRDNNGTAVTGANKEYCIPGDTAKCDAPVLELKFDEKSGTKAYDTSGNGNDGSITGATWERGKVGSALEFDGASNHVSGFDITPELNLDNNLSVGVWINPKSLSANQDSIVGQLYDWQISYNATGKITFRRWNDWQGVSSNSTLDLNKWHYVYVTLNNDASNNLRIYIDGKLDNIWTIVTPLNVGHGIRISGYIQSDIDYFHGLIDDLKIYNYARTPAQIAYDYNKGAPVGHWRFDECSGSTVHDESGNGNHGTIYLGTNGTTETGSCTTNSNSFWYNGRSGVRGASGMFDRVSDYVNAGPNINLANRSFSISAWAKRSTTGVKTYIIGQGTVSGGSQKLHFGWRYTNNFTCAFDGDDLDAPPHTDLNWHQWICTYNAENNTRVIYLDGVEVASGIANNDFQGTGDLIIGARYATPSELFGGQLDEVKIYNYGLTAEQVKNEYNGGALRFGD